MSSQPSADGAPTYELQRIYREAPVCPRCGHASLSESESCIYCGIIDKQAQEHGWDASELEEVLAEARTNHAAERAEQLAEVAGRSDQEIKAGWAAAEAGRAALEPDLQRPEFLGTKTDAEMSEAEREEVRQYAIARRFALPQGVPEFSTPIPSLACSLATEPGKVVPGYLLGFSTRAVLLGAGDPSNPVWTRDYPYNHVSEISIAGPEEPDRRVTKPRALAFGLFSLAAKKEYKSSYLLVANHADPALLVQIEGVSPVELQGHLAPLLGWYQQHQERLLALDNLWRG